MLGRWLTLVLGGKLGLITGSWWGSLIIIVTTCTVIWLCDDHTGYLVPIRFRQACQKGSLTLMKCDRKVRSNGDRKWQKKVQCGPFQVNSAFRIWDCTIPSLRLDVIGLMLRTTRFEMHDETLRRGAPLFVWLERKLYSNFADEISLRRGECKISYFFRGHFGLFGLLMKDIMVF